MAEAAPEQVVTSTPVDQDGNNTEYALGALLAALAAGGLGAVLLRSRRRSAKVADAPVIERPVVKQPVTEQTPRVAAGTVPTGTVQSTLTAAPIITRDDVTRVGEHGTVVENAASASSTAPVTREASSWKPVMASSAPTNGLANSGAAIALPRELPESVAERRALLDRMVAAQPDRANPFRTPKARRHRAKLILQSIGRTFESGRSRIDLSQYPRNWPELATNRPAVA